MRKNSKEIIGGLFLLLTAIITGLFTCHSEKTPKSEPTQKVRFDSGSAVTAGGAINQKGEKNVIVGGNATINYGDSTKHKAIKSGDTYIVKSDHQSGGIIAGKFELYNVTLVVPGENDDALKMENNFQYKIDSVRKIITVQPKTGEWEKTFLGIPNEDKISVSPHFMNEARNIPSMKFNVIFFQGDSLYTMISDASPASKDLSYSFHFNMLPKYFVFGNYPAPLYKAMFR
jgi:hypothetical protein